MQIFKAFIGSVGVAFDVIKQVARVRCGKQVEPTEVFERQQKLGFWQRFGIELAIDPSCILQLSLSTQAMKRFFFNVWNGERISVGCEFFQCENAESV